MGSYSYIDVLLTLLNCVWLLIINLRAQLGSNNSRVFNLSLKRFALCFIWCSLLFFDHHVNCSFRSPLFTIQHLAFLIHNAYLRFELACTLSLSWIFLYINSNLLGCWLFIKLLLSWFLKWCIDLGIFPIISFVGSTWKSLFAIWIIIHNIRTGFRWCACTCSIENTTTCNDGAS